MENKQSSPGSGIIAMIPTVDDYEKTVDELVNEARSIDVDLGIDCAKKLSNALFLINRVKRNKIKFDLATEEAIKSSIFETKDWLSTKTSARFDVISTLYKWKLEKFQHRAWDVAMSAADCEGLLFRLMERVNDDSQNVAVTQVFLSIQELESCPDSAVRTETRIKDALNKLKEMMADKTPMIGVVKPQ